MDNKNDRSGVPSNDGKQVSRSPSSITTNERFCSKCGKEINGICRLCRDCLFQDYKQQNVRNIISISLLKISNFTIVEIKTSIVSFSIIILKAMRRKRSEDRREALLKQLKAVDCQKIIARKSSRQHPYH